MEELKLVILFYLVLPIQSVSWHINKCQICHVQSFSFPGRSYSKTVRIFLNILRKMSTNIIYFLDKALLLSVVQSNFMYFYLMTVHNICHIRHFFKSYLKIGNASQCRKHFYCLSVMCLKLMPRSFIPLNKQQLWLQTF